MRVHHVFIWAVASAILLNVATARPTQAATPVQAEIEGLRRAYVNLVSGDHDYKGHRVRALKHVEVAARSLGLNISGDGKAHSQQKISDSDLGAARSALQGVLQMANSNGQAQIANSIAAAIKEINIALSVK